VAHRDSSARTVWRLARAGLAVVFAASVLALSQAGPARAAGPGAAATLVASVKASAPEAALVAGGNVAVNHQVAHGPFRRGNVVGFVAATVAAAALWLGATVALARRARRGPLVHRWPARGARSSVAEDAERWLRDL